VPVLGLALEEEPNFELRLCIHPGRFEEDSGLWASFSWLGLERTPGRRMRPDFWGIGNGCEGAGA
jgi:hypothetical protein